MAAAIYFCEAAKLYLSHYHGHMNRKVKSLFSIVLFLFVFACIVFAKQTHSEDAFISYTADVKKQNVSMYWKNDDNQPLKSLSVLKGWLDKKGDNLVFAMNGGMFITDNIPKGLFIQKQKLVTPLDIKTGEGNFYLQPNGVFYITTDYKAVVCKTGDFTDNGKIKYATQSGPMLMIDGAINLVFKQGSANLQIRNGVGILPGGKVIFAMSKKEINFYDFADYFKALGCKNALYLDGYVSRAYLPEKKWMQTDGNFGVIIGVTVKNTSGN